MKPKQKKRKNDFIFFLKVIDAKTGQAIAKIDKTFLDDIQESVDTLLKKLK